MRALPSRRVQCSPGVLRLAVLFSCVLLALGCSPSCFLKPSSRYDPSLHGPAPDYADARSWAALPDTRDHADLVPGGDTLSEGEQANAPADVFYIYPTAWFDKDVWNDPLDASVKNEVVDEIVLANQASAFNACCRVYAPRYRQSTISAYYGELEDAKRSFEVAYQDIERAFEAFIESKNGKRPFLIAGHSQGSMHGMRLLAKVDADPALRERFVAAYLPGYAMPMSSYEKGQEPELYHHIVPCTSASQTGCIVAWDTHEQGAKVSGRAPLLHWNAQGDLLRIDEAASRQCTNPVSWKMGEGERSSKASHLGAVAMINEGEALSFRKLVMSREPLGVKIVGLSAPVPGLFEAQCEQGSLFVPSIESFGWEGQETQPGDYHLLDYELFYMNIRQNALDRVRAHRTQLQEMKRDATRSGE